MLRFLQSHYRLFFWISLSAVMVVAALMQSSQACLVTDRTPLALLSLQLAGTPGRATEVLQTWRETNCGGSAVAEAVHALPVGDDQDDRRHFEDGLQAARQNTWIDALGFVPAYAFLLFMLCLRTGPRRHGLPAWARAAIWVACLGLAWLLLGRYLHGWQFAPLLAAAGVGFLFVKKTPPTAFPVALVVLAAVLDEVENAFLLAALYRASAAGAADAAGQPLLFAVPAILKISCLLLVFGYLLTHGFGAAVHGLRNFSRFVGSFLGILWQNRVVTLPLLVIYLLLWRMNQGQDLLINLNATLATLTPTGKTEYGLFRWSQGAMLLYAVLTVLAALAWFLPKYIARKDLRGVSLRDLITGDWNYNTPGPKRSVIDSSKLPYLVYVPRLFGVLMFVIPACGVLHALRVFQIHYALDAVNAHVLLLVSTGAYLLLLYPFFDESTPGAFGPRVTGGAGNNCLEEVFHWLRRRGLAWLYAAVVVGLLLLMLLFMRLNDGYPADLTYLASGLYCLSLAFALLVSIRRYLGSPATPAPPRIFGWFWRQNPNPWVLGPALLVAVLFIVANLAPVWLFHSPYARPWTIGAVFSGFVFYMLFFSLLLVVGRKWKINLAGFFVAWMIFAAFALNNPFHDVPTVALDSTYAPTDLDAHIGQWLETRRGDIAQYRATGKPYPVVLVNAHGGGVRAAAWTTMAIARLDSLVASDTGTVLPRDRFQNHVLAYSGASGGTVGASVLSVYRHQYGDSLEPFQADALINLYVNDFLTPVFLGMMGRDVFFSTFHVTGAADRARLQTDLWEKYLGPQLGDLYAREFSSLWRDANGGVRTDIPLLFSNTYRLETGQKAVIAPVDLGEADFPASLAVNTYLRENGVPEKNSLPFGTAVFLSARFPFLSPAGRLDSAHHFLDGGYTENSGAATALEIYRVFRRVQAQKAAKDTLFNAVEVQFLSLDNEPPLEKEPEFRNVFELTAPLQGLFKVRTGNTNKAEIINQDVAGKGCYYRLQPLKRVIERRDDEGETHRFRPVLPLGWQISFPALIRMKESLDSTCLKEQRIDGLLGKFKRAEPGRRASLATQ